LPRLLSLRGAEIRPEGIKITSACDILPLISYLANRKQEHFVCVSLNGASEVIATRVVSVGLVNNVQVHPREVFADPITDRATAVIVAHNHPSGSVAPSQEDIEVTKRLKDAGNTLGIKLIDHIISAARVISASLKTGRCLINKEYITENHALMMYQPFIEYKPGQKD